MKWTAAARQALAAGRSNAAPDEEMIKALLHEKFENPMLGIYAGHLLAMQDKPNLVLLREVVDSLTGLVGNHPDVTPLLIPLNAARAGNILYSEPPMLRRSWSIIVNASTPKKDLRPPHSYAARIGASLWGSGAWLAWRMPGNDIEMGTDLSKDLLPALYAQAESGKLAEPIRQLMDSEEGSKLGSVEALLARYLDLASRQFSQAQRLTVKDDQRHLLSPIYSFFRLLGVDSDLQSDTRKALSASTIMKLTGLPYSTIVQAAASLAVKLGVTQGAKSLSQVLGALKYK